MVGSRKINGSTGGSQLTGKQMHKQTIQISALSILGLESLLEISPV